MIDRYDQAKIKLCFIIILLKTYHTNFFISKKSDHLQLLFFTIIFFLISTGRNFKWEIQKLNIYPLPSAVLPIQYTKKYIYNFFFKEICLRLVIKTLFYYHYFCLC